MLRTHYKNILSLAKRYREALLIFGILSASLAACGPGGDTPPDSPSIQPTPTVEAQPPAAPTPEPPAAEPAAIMPVPDAPLSTTGPWLVFSTADSLWAVNRDGTGLTKLSGQVASWRFPVGSVAAPSGGQVAYITGVQERYQLTLNVFSFAANQSRVITALTSEDTEPDPDAAVFERRPDLEAALHSESLAWSPDGNQLAFVGSIEGPTSDLYVTSSAADDVTRLTSGPAQAYQLSWSPDGETILHFGVDSFGTGAGYSMAGVWTARPDDSGVTSPYTLQDTYAEELVGWIDADTFVVYSWDAGCGSKNLKAVDWRQAAETVLWGDYFQMAALDPNSGNILIAVSDWIETCSPDVGQGLYLAVADGSNPVKIIDDNPGRIAWSPQAEVFFATTEFGTLAIGSYGDWVQIHDFTGQIPAASPVDKVLAWYGDEGLWVGNMNSSLDLPQPVQLFTQPVKAAIWGPEGEYLFFFGEENLYVARMPDLELMLAAEGIIDAVIYGGGNAAWVYP